MITAQQDRNTSLYAKTFVHVTDLSIKVTIKLVNFTLQHALNPQKGSRGKTLLFL